MKRIIVISVCLLLFLSSSYAFGAEGLYASGNIGVAFLTDSDISQSGFPTVEASFDTGFAVAGAIGTSMGKFRLEGEASYQKNDFDEIENIGVDGDVTALSLLLNGYFDFSTNSAWTPYLTAGLGVSKVEVNDLLDDINEDDTVFAYQLGAGIGYAAGEKVVIDAKYRYFATADPDFNGTDAEVASHNIYVGMRFNFQEL